MMITIINQMYTKQIQGLNQIKKEYLLESIESALVTAYKRNFDALENVDVKMDEQTGATHVYAIKEVMERANDDRSGLELHI